MSPSTSTPPYTGPCSGDVTTEQGVLECLAGQGGRRARRGARSLLAALFERGWNIVRMRNGEAIAEIRCDAHEEPDVHRQIPLGQSS